MNATSPTILTRSSEDRWYDESGGHESPGAGGGIRSNECDGPRRPMEDKTLKWGLASYSGSVEKSI
ncbi:MAG: hypothetical protein ACQET1_05785 [Gemmatimonadota bacterium]